MHHAEQPFAEADRERLHPHAAHLRNHKVPKLMHHHHNAEHDRKPRHNHEVGRVKKVGEKRQREVLENSELREAP